MIGSVWYFWKRSKGYRLELCSVLSFSGKISFDAGLLKHTLLNGSSEFIGQMSTGIAMFAYNFVIMHYIGVDGVTAFTIVGYVAYVFSMIIVGFGQGASPLISYSYGAGERRLAAKIRRCTSVLVLLSGVLTFLVMVPLAGWYGGLFVKGAAVQDMIREGMLIFMSSFFLSGFNVVTSFYFTAGLSRHDRNLAGSAGDRGGDVGDQCVVPEARGNISGDRRRWLLTKQSVFVTME